MKSVLRILILFFTLLSCCASSAQHNSDSSVTNRNSFFIEIGGSAPQISLNYDFLIFTKNENIKYALTIGSTHHFNNVYDFVFAPQFNTLIGKKLMAEIGMGITIPIAFINDWVLIPRFGARYHKNDKGMFYKIAFTPIISPKIKTNILPMFGVSIGYTLKRNIKNKKS